MHSWRLFRCIGYGVSRVAVVGGDFPLRVVFEKLYRVTLCCMGRGRVIVGWYSLR